MVLAEVTATKREKSEAPSHGKNSDKREKPLTKVVIRRLPPSMTQEEFLNQVSPIPLHNYIYTIKGDQTLGGNAFARVYVNFTNAEDIYIFKEKFDNYVFIDGNGHEYAAVVEYAAFQKVPKRRKQRVDLKAATIDADPTYLAFLEHLTQQPNQEEKPEYNLNLTHIENKNDVTTPLLEYLKQRKVERMRIREEKREERRKKEQEKKKMREEDRRKRLEDKKHRSVTQKESKKDQKERENDTEATKTSDDLTFKDTPDDGEVESKIPSSEVLKKAEKSDKPPKKEEKLSFKNRTKYEEKKQQQQQKNKMKYEDRKEFKNRRDEFRNREHDASRNSIPKKPDVKLEQQQPQKKVKKYSERREERKNVEATKHEARKAETSKNEQVTEEPKCQEASEKIKKVTGETAACKSDESEHFGKKNKENDPRTQRRIRNKDRPAMQIYKPGMLRKKSVDNDKECVVIDEEKMDIKEKSAIED